MEGQITPRTGLKWFEHVFSLFFEETGRSHAYWAFPIAYWAFPIAIGRLDGSWLMAQASWLMAKGGQGRLMAHGQGPAG